MRMALRRRLAAAEDSGSALILALLVVLVGSLLIGAALDFARGGLTIAPKARELRNQNNYLQGAADGAINAVRSSTTYGRTDGAACPAYTAPAAASGLQGATTKTFTVTCTPKTVVGGSSPDQPDFAIQALGNAAGEGINQVGGNHTLVVDGGLYSRGRIAGGTLSNAGIEVNGSVFAEGACSNVTTTDVSGLHCGYTPAGGSTFGSDPQYRASITDDSDLATLIGPDTAPLTGADPVPSCASPGSPLVELQPGYYSVTPQTLVETLTNCSGSTYHFNPGRYYFNYDTTWNPSPSAQLKLVGGTLASTYSVGGNLGGACDASKPGVQFVMGGNTQLVVDNASQLELCGPTPAQNFTGAPQRIVFYGLSSNANNNARTGPPPDAASTLSASAAPTTGSGSAAFTNPQNAQTIDGLSASYIPGAKNRTGTLSFPSLQHLPKGARVSSVSIHYMQTLVNATSSLVLKTISQPDITVPLLPSCPVTGCEKNITSDIVGSGATWRDINSMVLAYSASTSTATGSAAVDGLNLSVTYTPPALEALSCSACKLVDGSGNNALFFHGTVYTPSAAWTVDVHNDSGNIFDRGVVVRTIDIIVSASSKQTTSPFRLPSATPQGRLVLFHGYIDGVELLRACISYVDRAGSGSTAIPMAGYQVAVRHWSVFKQPTAEDPDCH